MLTYAVGVNAYRAYKIERSYNLLQLYIEKHIIGYRGEQPLRERISEFENKVNADKKKIRRVFFSKILKTRLNIFSPQETRDEKIKKLKIAEILL